jgi:hypothetical protein|tara:strand:+ start:1095 stop:1454 length:360 start_codon:yes stop_codon:yes gene_type:complete
MQIPPLAQKSLPFQDRFQARFYGRVHFLNWNLFISIKTPLSVVREKTDAILLMENSGAPQTDCSLKPPLGVCPMPLFFWKTWKVEGKRYRHCDLMLAYIKDGVNSCHTFFSLHRGLHSN